MIFVLHWRLVLIWGCCSSCKNPSWKLKKVEWRPLFHKRITSIIFLTYILNIFKLDLIGFIILPIAIRRITTNLIKNFDAFYSNQFHIIVITWGKMMILKLRLREFGKKFFEAWMYFCLQPISHHCDADQFL